jgi:hypothetical protein
MKAETATVPGITDTTVSKRTGKTWDDWFILLDDAGAAAMSHQQIVALLGEQAELSHWWRQSIAVAYEQARGLRDKHEKADGYQISASKTFHCDVAVIYAHWHDANKRKRWLTEQMQITTATEKRSLRIRWEQGGRVDVNLYEIDENKCRVTVNHGKLSDAATASRMKEFWKQRLAALGAAAQR